MYNYENHNDKTWFIKIYIFKELESYFFDNIGSGVTPK